MHVLLIHTNCTNIMRHMEGIMPMHWNIHRLGPMRDVWSMHPPKPFSISTNVTHQNHSHRYKYESPESFFIGINITCRNHYHLPFGNLVKIDQKSHPRKLRVNLIFLIEKHDTQRFRNAYTKFLWKWVRNHPQNPKTQY